MKKMKFKIFKWIYFWTKVFTRYETHFILTVSAGLLSGLVFNYVVSSPLTNYIFMLSGVLALILLTSLVTNAWLYKFLWVIVEDQSTHFGLELQGINKENLVKEWVLSQNFKIILAKESLKSFIYLQYSPEMIRSDYELFLKILSDEDITSEVRGKLVDKYYAVYTPLSLRLEPHREDIFLKIISLELPFVFEEGLERYHSLFKDVKIRKKMAQRGWHHSLMRSLLGEEYFNYEIPPLSLFPLNTNFSSWYSQVFGKKPALKRLIQDKIINHVNKSVRWNYFKFLQAYEVFDLNYDILVRDMETCLNDGQVSPFACGALFSDLKVKTHWSKSISYLKSYYGDSKILRLIKKIKDPSEFNQVLEVIGDCLDHDYRPRLPKKVRDWKELNEYAKEEQKKAQQQDFSLEQYSIYDWEGQKVLNYTIWVPKRNFKLIRGGTEMHNCVGNGEYARRIINKNSFVFFLKKGKKTQVCIELNRDDGSIKSIKGLANNEAPAGVLDAVQSFLNNNK